jgi:hypothetical protein
VGPDIFAVADHACGIQMAAQMRLRAGFPVVAPGDPLSRADLRAGLHLHRPLLVMRRRRVLTAPGILGDAITGGRVRICPTGSVVGIGISDGDHTICMTLAIDEDTQRGW